MLLIYLGAGISCLYRPLKPIFRMFQFRTVCRLLNGESTKQCKVYLPTGYWYQSRRLHGLGDVLFG